MALRLFGSDDSCRDDQQSFAAARPYKSVLTELIRVTVLLAAVSFLSPSLVALDIDEAEKLLAQGEYAKCLLEADKGVESEPYVERWWTLKLNCQLTLGLYKKSLETMELALGRHRLSIQLRILGHEVFQKSGEADKAQLMLEQINDLISTRPWRYGDSINLVAQGRAALLLGADARQVLELFYDKSIEQNPQLRDGYIASGQLALDKNDFAVASKTLQLAAKKFADDPRILFRLAKALGESNSPLAKKHLDRALELNPNYLDALLFQVDYLINSEQYEAAELKLRQVLRINPHHADAWCYRAVLAHLGNDSVSQKLHRMEALKFWKTNPRVDYLIGKKLSQKYRFTEGSEHQRQALKFDENYLAAKMQLSQDLLRLGQVAEGWVLAHQVHDQDGYNLVAFNLVTLQDKLAKYTTLEDEKFIIRMEAHEAKVYGQQVVKLLHRAKETLDKKYGYSSKDRITVEIFPQQKDFAIRTFGIPGGAGFLGVCFGKVITANSPASRAEHPTNWHSVLWHEYCHVVTLQLTRNKMPRWLSEGISVYEERQAHPAWGARMSPSFRLMILEDQLTPVSQLSGAFLSPSSAQHLQFAYYQSSLVVQFLIERHGFDKLKAVLTDLGQGTAINDALQKHYGEMDQIEKQFNTYARKKAEQLAPKIDWDAEGVKPMVRANTQGLAKWVEEHPTNLAGLQLYAGRLMVEKKFAQAKKVLERLIKLFPHYVGDGTAYRMLAQLHRQDDELDKERAVLEALAKHDPDAVDVYMRLMELASQKKDWPDVMTNAQRMLAVNPLVRSPYEFLADASEQLGKSKEAIEAHSTALHLNPADPARIHYRLAKLLYKDDIKQAKRHVLEALSEAPRYRKAHQLLLKIITDPPPKPAPEPPSEPSSKPPTETAPATKKKDTPATPESPAAPAAKAAPQKSDKTKKPEPKDTVEKPVLKKSPVQTPPVNKPKLDQSKGNKAPQSAPPKASEPATDNGSGKAPDQNSDQNSDQKPDPKPDSNNSNSKESPK